MTTLLHRRMIFVAGFLSVLLLTARPGLASSTDKDLAEIKSNLNTVLTEIQSLNGATLALDRKLDATSNGLRGDVSALQTSLRPAAASGADAQSQKQAQFAALLQNLSNDVSQLTVQIGEIKSNGRAVDYKSEVSRQLAGFSAELTSISNALQNVHAPVAGAGVDPVTKSNIAYLAANSSRSGKASPGWPEFTLLGLAGVSVLLLLILLLTFSKRLGTTERTMLETRDALARFGVQMENRVKLMEGSSTAVNATAEKVTTFLGQVETAIQAQLETLAKKINSSQLTELVEATALSKTEISRLRAETATLQKSMTQMDQGAKQFLDEMQKKSGQMLLETKAATQQSLGESQRHTQQFMEELQATTRKWIADFERQTHSSIGQIKAEADSFDKMFWPGPFLGEGKLSPARERIRARAGANDPAAFALLLGLGELKLCLANRGGDHSRTVESLDRLGQLAYRFWKIEPDASVETTFDAAQAWGAEINKLLTANNVPLSLRIIMPRATFDMGTMLSESSLTGSTTRVHEPLSWTVINNAGENHKVLVTGKVITE